VGLVHPSGATLTRKELGYALALQVEEFIDVGSAFLTVLSLPDYLRYIEMLHT
jgi:hypothetical protein